MPLFDRPPIDAISISNALFSSGTFRITGGPGVLVGSDASGASISASDPVSVDYFDNMGGGLGPVEVSGTAIVFNTLVLQPLNPFGEKFPAAMTVNTAMWDMGSFASFTNSNSSASTNAWTSSFMLGIYTLVNSTQLSLWNSALSTRAQGANAGNSTNFMGGSARWITFHSSLWSSAPNFSKDQYWFAVICRSSGISIQGSSNGMFMMNTAQRGGTFGAATVNATSQGWYPFMGIHQTSQTAMPVSIAASQINRVTASANFIPHIAFNASFSVV